MIGAISTRCSFSNNGLSLSGPAALSGVKWLESFRMPFPDMSMWDNTCIVVRHSCGTIPGSKLHKTLKLLLLYSC